MTSFGSQQDDLLNNLLHRSAQSRLHYSGDFPVVDEHERSRLLRTGGRYCGHVQERVSRVFEALWVENTISYFQQRHMMVRLYVLTKAYSGTISKPLLSSSDAACYVTSATLGTAGDRYSRARRSFTHIRGSGGQRLKCPCWQKSST